MVDPFVSVGMYSQPMECAPVIFTATYHLHFSFAIVLDIDRERLVQASILLVEGQEGLVWPRSALPIFRGQGDFEGVASGEGKGARSDW